MIWIKIVNTPTEASTNLKNFDLKNNMNLNGTWTILDSRRFILKWNWKLEIENENWKLKIKVKIDIQNWNWRLEYCNEDWNWTLKLKIEMEIEIENSY